MKVKISPPSAMDVLETTTTETGIEVTPIMVGKQYLLRVAYIQVLGDKGNKANCIVCFNARTGAFTLQYPDKPAVAIPFDGDVDDFRKQQVKRAGQKALIEKPAEVAVNENAD